MQQPLSHSPQLDCLSIELTGTPRLDSSDGIQYLDLNLTLHFKEVWQPVMGGGFKFGLTGGKLLLNLENAKMPSELNLLTNLVEVRSQQAETVTCQVTPMDTHGQYSWTFGVKTGASVLLGSLELLNLQHLQVTGTPVRIEARFEVSPEHLQPIEAENLWPHEIGPNKHGILERILTQTLVRQKLQPYLTRSTLEYANLSEPPRAKQEIPEASECGLGDISQAIPRILEAKTADFLELATLANLNPATDFAGAKLWGCSLTNLDLSGASLRGVKLRGADLSDADLSEADLTDAQLAGADLSGALLSDANFAGADLHRSSLALANLSGAILTDANLHEANLSNANLSDADLSNANLSGADLHQAGLMLTNLTGTNLTDAKVEQARFKKDAGLSPEMERDLKARGAIFE
ncbi:pentapeptide repeat-containing protein [Phormidium sp. CCY1219]|uniref:pentapeptide repeat-containing protein n=1 Tax=Phormidium sp. CCY1219 TaxID=2886104 RepID=UPI002D1F6D64|nr:pentapeptide repeat-containing protein [Phormidium sp. CCY1219]MEB3831604.1 pentapeptide repeat-containing protein [Phormidium sp. CCY1219]